MLTKIRTRDKQIQRNQLIQQLPGDTAYRATKLSWLVQMVRELQLDPIELGHVPIWQEVREF